MGTDGQQSFVMTYPAQNDQLPENNHRQPEFSPLQEVPVRVNREEAMTLMNEGSNTGVAAAGNDDDGDDDSASGWWSCLRKLQQLRYLPVVTFIWIILSFVICYIVAGTLEHVEFHFPYISHTGVEVPERGIFSQMVNIGALMFAVNMYVKHLQVETVMLLGTSHRHRDRRINTASMVIGFLSALGLTFVANFQTKEMKVVHYTGAFTAFVCGMVYCWMQTSLSIRHKPRCKITYFQIVNSFLLTVSLIIFGVSKAVYKTRESTGNGTKFDTLRTEYLISTYSEWLTAIFTIMYVLTYYQDFSTISLIAPRVQIRNSQKGNQNHHSSSRMHDIVNV